MITVRYQDEFCKANGTSFTIGIVMYALDSSRDHRSLCRHVYSLQLFNNR